MGYGDKIGYVYKSELYCRKCGEAIMLSLRERLPQYEIEERKKIGDSEGWPQGFILDEERNESDSPNHCASQDACLDGEILDRDALGGKELVGQLLTYHLTREGVAYVRHAIAEDPGKPLMQLWAQRFKDQLPRRWCCGTVLGLPHENDCPRNEPDLHLMRTLKFPTSRGLVTLRMYDTFQSERGWTLIGYEIEEAGKVQLEGRIREGLGEPIDSNFAAAACLNLACAVERDMTRGEVDWIGDFKDELHEFAACLRLENHTPGIWWCLECGDVDGVCGHSNDSND